MDSVSPELVALLAACRARPADDLPRLVLADWLDENGQSERAEFVRVQVELSHPTADAERILLLRNRARELLSVHRSAWIGKYVRLAGGASPAEETLRRRNRVSNYPDWMFERGLLQLRELRDALGRIPFRKWLASPEACWLDRVKLHYWSVDDFVKADLPDELHGRIELQLTLDYTMDQRQARKAFRLLAVSSNFTAVRSLILNGGGSGETALNELVRADLSQLVELNLQPNGGDVEQMAKQIASAPFTALSCLEIGPISGTALRTLIRSTHLGNMTDLNLSQNKLGDSGMVALCESKLAPTLRVIRLANINIGDKGTIALARSVLFANLQGLQLNLMMNKIGDAGLAALAESEHLHRFRELVLRENRVGDAGAEALAQSPYAANMRYVDFWRNNITDRGAFALARSPYLNKVVDLCVKENQLTEAGAAALHERFGEAAKV